MMSSSIGASSLASQARAMPSPRGKGFDLTPNAPEKHKLEGWKKPFHTHGVSLLLGPLRRIKLEASQLQRSSRLLSVVRRLRTA